MNIDQVAFTDEARFSLCGPDNFMSWQLKNESSAIFRERKAFNSGEIIVHIDAIKLIYSFQHAIVIYSLVELSNKQLSLSRSMNETIEFLSIPQT